MMMMIMRMMMMIIIRMVMMIIKKSKDSLRSHDSSIHSGKIKKSNRIPSKENLDKSPGMQN